MTDLEELVKANLGPPGDFMFSDKGKEISKLLQKRGIEESPKDLFKWLTSSRAISNPVAAQIF